MVFIKSILLIPILSAAALYGSDYFLSVSADTTKFDYAETDSNGDLLDTERADFGNIYGFTLSLQPRYYGFYLNASYAKGDTDYVGSLVGSGDPYGSYRTITTNELEDYTFGYKSTAFLDPSNKIEMPIIVGIGYRRWLRQLHGSPGVASVDELYDWGYYTIGTGLHFRLSNTVVIGADAEYRKAFSAQMYENYHGYTFDLKNVHGYKITVPFEIVHTPRLSTFISYNYEYWNIGASNEINTWYEPDSETKNQTLSFGLKFKF